MRPGGSGVDPSGSTSFGKEAEERRSQLVAGSSGEAFVCGDDELHRKPDIRGKNPSPTKGRGTGSQSETELSPTLGGGHDDEQMGKGRRGGYGTADAGTKPVGDRIDEFPIAGKFFRQTHLHGGDWRILTMQ